MNEKDIKKKLVADNELQSVSPVPRTESDFWQYIDAVKVFVEKD